ncbi:conjugal transfer protein [Streptomyces sp. NPDC094143]|uniref:conjugal transfer protein n=1 Tax=Streptomyces sp. NPDC094143 TaxID=3155310 RepID=UPI003325D8F7
MSPGKPASRSEAVAPMAAGARLEAMRRRVRVSRLAVWTVIAAGPIALGITLTSTPTTVETASSTKPTTARVTTVAAGPAGYAQLFLHTWLRSSTKDEASAQARHAQSMAPGVDLPEPATGAQPAPQVVTAVRTAQRAQGVWSVTVAAQYADASVRYYAVPVATDRTGASFTVTGAPGVVAGPARREMPASPYRESVPEGDLSSTVEQFLAAYLTGAGEVDRYLAPGVKLLPVTPAPYRAVTVQQISAIEETATTVTVPADGTKARVLAQVEARGKDGRWPLAYEFTLAARSGRWEISALGTGAAATEGVR